MSLPASFVTMVGRAGPTIVWSSAPRNRPSMTANRISILARIGNPSAGSSSRLGAVMSRSTGIDSIEAPSSGTAGLDGDAVRSGLGMGSSVAVLVIREVVRADLLRHGLAQVADGRQDPLEPWLRQPAEDRPQPVLLERLDLVTDPGALGRCADENDAAVVGNADPIDEATLRHPVDETGRVAHRDVEQLGEPAHRDVAVML